MHATNYRFQIKAGLNELHKNGMTTSFFVKGELLDFVLNLINKIEK